MTVDGANNGIRGSCPGLNVVGIYYQEASGVIDRAATRNQTTPCFHDARIFLESFGCGGFFPLPSGYTLSGNTMTDGNNGLRMTNSNTTAPNTYSSVTTPVSSCT